MCSVYCGPEVHITKGYLPYLQLIHIDRTWLSISTANRAYELSRSTHVTPFHIVHSTGISNYKL